MAFKLDINGEQHSFDSPPTVAVLVASLGLEGRRLAVEVNGGVVPRSEHGARVLADGDRVEIVHAIGGG